MNDDKYYWIIPLINIDVFEFVMIDDVAQLCKTPGLHHTHKNMDCTRKLVKSQIFEIVLKWSFESKRFWKWN